ncbi:MAG: hypothetical protein JNM59_06460 [Hyphomonadaceae bacterium]|nr:hypothetical protein [Hyphomonadaceae bacterium]
MSPLASLLLLLVPIALMAVIQVVLEANARPKGRDLVMLTASAHGERVLAYRVCGACFQEVQPSALANTIFDSADAHLEPVLGVVRQMTGGIWVGGRVILTTHRVVFLPNGLNRMLQDNLPTIALALADVSEAKQRFGLATAIVAIRSPAFTLTVRGYRMRSFVADIERARADRR